MESSVDIGCQVNLRALNGRPYTGSGGEMGHGVGPLRSKCAQNSVFISNIDGMETNVSENRSQISSFNLGVVKVIEIIDDRDSVPIG